MAKTVANLLIAIYESEDGAEASLDQLREIQQDALKNVHAAVAIKKDLNSGLQYKNAGLTPEKGALGGVIIGGLIGILSGGVGIVLGGLGAIVGGLIGEKKRRDRFASSEINQIITTLAPGTSTLILVVKPEQREQFTTILEAGGADVVTAEVPSELADQLDSHRAEAYAHWREQIGE